VRLCTPLLDLGVVGVVMDSYYQPILSPVKQKPTGLLVSVELLLIPSTRLDSESYYPCKWSVEDWVHI